LGWVILGTRKKGQFPSSALSLPLWGKENSLTSFLLLARALSQIDFHFWRLSKRRQHENNNKTEFSLVPLFAASVFYFTFFFFVVFAGKRV